MTAAVDKVLTRRMERPVVTGLLWWRRERFMTPEEGMAWLDGRDDDAYWIWTPRETAERPYRGRIERRQTLLCAADAALSVAGDKTLTLDAAEIQMLELLEVAA